MEAGQQVKRLMVTATEPAIEPLIDSVAHSVEAILLTVHKEDFSGEPAGGDTAAAPAPACSLYMKGAADIPGTDCARLLVCVPLAGVRPGPGPHSAS